MKKTDTIAAVATAMGSSGIGIIRVSGEEAFSIAEKIFRRSQGKRGTQPGKSVPQKIRTDVRNIYYGHIYDGEELLDEVLLIVMKGPHSYTAEDTVEINCHGGVLMMKKILETVIKYGARPAEPGEFTKRAFLNGRIDLSQAEAVMDVINSGNQYALKSSVGQLKGRLSEKIRELREKIIFQLAHIESALDDPEHVSLEGYPKVLGEVLKPVITDIEKLLKSADKIGRAHV